MTDAQIAQKIAELAWEVQPKFRHRFNSVEELADRILVGHKNGGTFGWFLPVCILETFCAVDDMRATLAHAQLDEVMGTSTVDSESVARAKANLAGVSHFMPMFEQYCGGWVDGDPSRDV